MIKKLPKYLVAIFAWVTVIYPLYVAFSNRGWSFDSSLISNIFPLLGILAFCLLWLHSISGVFEDWLRQQFDFDRFVHITASIILICIILHPLLLLIVMDFNISDIFLLYGVRAITLAIVGWLLLITYDIGKPFRNKEFIKKNWNKILIISNIGFLLTFFHSIEIGSDLQSGPLRFIWIFYGITAFLSIFYTYTIMPFLKKNNPL